MPNYSSPRLLSPYDRFRVDALLNLGPEHEKPRFDAVPQLVAQAHAVG